MRIPIHYITDPPLPLSHPVLEIRPRPAAALLIYRVYTLLCSWAFKALSSSTSIMLYMAALSLSLSLSLALQGPVTAAHGHKVLSLLAKF